MDTKALLKKYQVAVPRYTSYPTVPYWESENFHLNSWKQAVTDTFKLTNSSEGISLYIHLPFCESLCTYCGCNTRITKNHKVELPYINAVLKEWSLYLNLLPEKPVIRELHLGGGTPTFFSAQNLNLLISGILKHSTIHPQAEFSFEAHPANTTSEHLSILFQLGFRRLSLGIQDFDPRVQFIINRFQTYQDVESVTAQARAIGYHSINYDLIYGLPLQTLEGLTETIDQVLTLKPERIAFYSYAHVPWLKPGQRRYTEKDLPDTEVKDLLYETGRQKLKDGGYYEVGMDHFTLSNDSLYHAQASGNLHRNFMGYTDNHSSLLIGLGVSSISDSWTAFAQNVKKVEEYLQLIDEGQFPITKGHLLTQEDLLIRRHILNLMCNGISPLNEQNQHPTLLSGLNRMQALVNDNLVSITKEKIEVTSTGKRFLRNICMALDARLWANQPTTPLFSLAG